MAVLPGYGNTTLANPADFFYTPPQQTAQQTANATIGAFGQPPPSATGTPTAAPTTGTTPPASTTPSWWLQSPTRSYYGAFEGKPDAQLPWAHYATNEGMEAARNWLGGQGYNMTPYLSKPGYGMVEPPQWQLGFGGVDSINAGLAAQAMERAKAGDPWAMATLESDLRAMQRGPTADLYQPPTQNPNAAFNRTQFPGNAPAPTPRGQVTQTPGRSPVVKTPGGYTRWNNPNPFRTAQSVLMGQSNPFAFQGMLNMLSGRSGYGYGSPFGGGVDLNAFGIRPLQSLGQGLGNPFGTIPTMNPWTPPLGSGEIAARLWGPQGGQASVNPNVYGNPYVGAGGGYSEMLRNAIETDPQAFIEDLRRKFSTINW